MAVFEQRNFVLTLSFINGFSQSGCVAFMLQEVLAIFTMNALLTSLYVLPFPIAAIVGAAVAAALTYKLKEFRAVATGMAATLTLGADIFAVIRPHISYAAFFFPCALAGFATGGFGMIVPVLATLSTPNHLIATSVAFCYATQDLGGAAGIAIFSTVLTTKLKRYITATLVPALIEAGLPLTSVQPLLADFATGDAAAIAEIPGLTPTVPDVLQVSDLTVEADSFRYIWYSMTSFAAVAMIIAALIQPTAGRVTSEVAFAVEDTVQHVPEAKEIAM